MNKQIAETFLFAKLCRAINTIPNLKPCFDNVQFISSVTNLDGKLAMLCGTFKLPNGWLVFQFAITFSTSVQGDQVSGLWQLAIAAKPQRDERVWAFLSIIDYLIDIGLLPSRSRKYHEDRISKGGVLGGVAGSIAEYGDFCERAAKDLPYDLSLKALARIKYRDFSEAAA